MIVIFKAEGYHMENSIKKERFLVASVVFKTTAMIDFKALKLLTIWRIETNVVNSQKANFLGRFPKAIPVIKTTEACSALVFFGRRFYSGCNAHI